MSTMARKPPNNTGTLGTVLIGGLVHQVFLRPDSTGARPLTVVQLAVAALRRLRRRRPAADRCPDPVFVLGHLFADPSR
jgi:hypothetical protein